MQKPSLTEFQKEKFKELFELILSQAPQKVKDLWDGNIHWIGDLPNFNHPIPMKLQGKAANDYVILLNKLNDRNL